MASGRLSVLSHLKLLALRCTASSTAKIAELAQTVADALEEIETQLGRKADTDTVPTLVTGTAIPADSDLDTYTTVGNYYCTPNDTAATIVNSPTANAFKMTVEYATGNANYLVQELRDYTGKYIYRRLYNVPSKAWTSWSSYLPVSGGTMTGSLTLAADPTADMHAATKKYVDDGVKDIEVGGRNLLLNSEGERSVTYTSGNVFMDFDYSEDLLNTAWDDEYVFSCEAKGDVDGLRMDFYFRSAGSTSTTALSKEVYQTVTAEYARYTAPVVFKSGYSLDDLSLCRLRLSTAGTLTVRKVKLERGNKATDWTPAPEDPVIESTSISIPVSSWATNTDAAPLSAGFAYYADVSVTGLAAEDSADTILDYASMAVAKSCGMSNTSTPRAGAIRYYAASKPTTALSAQLRVLKG